MGMVFPGPTGAIRRAESDIPLRSVGSLSMNRALLVDRIQVTPFVWRAHDGADRPAEPALLTECR
jgi:hypothetical protein